MLMPEDRQVLLEGSKGSQLNSNDGNGGNSTRLYCRNVDVDQENKQRLEALPGEAVEFHCADSFTGQREKLTRVLAQSHLPTSITLKEGSCVMILRNIRLPSQCLGNQPPLVNGTVGTVVKFEPADANVVAGDWATAQQGQKLVWPV